MSSFVPSRFPDIVETSGTTATILLPVMIKLLERSGALARSDLSRIDTVGCGASVVPQGASRAILLRGAKRFVHLYGSTECLTPIFARVTAEPEDRTSTLLDGPLGTIDARLTTDGELLLRGSAVTQGYEGDDFAARGSDGARWWHTGDLFERVAGSWAFVGRTDDLIKVSGWSVSPALTERVVLGIAGVAACGVGMEHEPSGRESLVCLVEGEASRDEIHAACSAELDTHQVPRHTRHVDRVPLNPMGKVDRRKLDELIRSSTTVAATGRSSLT